MRYAVLFLSFSLLIPLFAQEQTLLKLAPNEIEELFFRQNLQFIAEQLNIDKADAEIVQAKLWNNPSLSLNQVNLWSAKSQREGENEVIPPLFGSFGKNTEFSVELSQLIRTGNKRRKLIEREKAGKEITIREFEEIIRGLKIELRKTVWENLFLQSYLNVLEQQERSYIQLTESYKTQTEKGNIPKTEYLRIRSLWLELQHEIMETTGALNEQQKLLKILLCSDPGLFIEIKESESEPVPPDRLSRERLPELARESRPDIKSALLRSDYYTKAFDYEKAQRIPDLSFNITYDRFGGVWKDFIGFGISMDLPFFNRNQGNIKSARIAAEQSRYTALHQQNQAEQEIMEAYDNYVAAFSFWQKITKEDLFGEPDQLLAGYTKNLMNRNVGLLEFIDFMEAYKTNKQILFAAKKRMNISFDELQYSVGTELK